MFSRLDLKRGLIVIVCTLAGCRSGVLQPAGPVGVVEARLIVETFVAMLLVVIPVFVMTGLFAWRYAPRPQTAVMRQHGRLRGLWKA